MRNQKTTAITVYNSEGNKEIRKVLEKLRELREESK